MIIRDLDECSMTALPSARSLTYMLEIMCLESLINESQYVGLGMKTYPDSERVRCTASPLVIVLNKS